MLCDWSSELYRISETLSTAAGPCVTHSGPGLWTRATRKRHRAGRRCGSSFHHQPADIKQASVLRNVTFSRTAEELTGGMTPLTWNTTLDFSSRYVRMLAPMIWYLLSKPIWMYFPKRLLLSLRVVFAFPIACEEKRVGVKKKKKNLQLQ